MSYYTTVKVVNKDGEAVKADVSCGGKNRGFTDPNTGEISFELVGKDLYDVYAKRLGDTASGKVRGGKTVTLRLG